MDFKEMLKRIEARMFDSDLIYTILKAYQEKEEIDSDYYCGYTRSVTALYDVFDHEERQMLVGWEAYLRAGLGEKLRFGFRQGVFAAFQHLYAQKAPNRPFSELLETEQLDARDEHVCEVLAKGDEERDLHLRALQDIWENRRNEMKRCGFYLGYQYAVGIAGETAPAMIGERMRERIFRTEVDLELKEG